MLKVSHPEFGLHQKLFISKAVGQESLLQILQKSRNYFLRYLAHKK